MAKVINENKGNEIIPRALIFDTRLSDRARFVYCYMSAKPEGWDFIMEPMAKELGYSVDTLRKYLKELMDYGWITRGEQKHDDSTMRFGSYEYTINNKPSRIGKNPIREKAASEKSRTGKSSTQDYNSTINSTLNTRLERDNAPTPTRISDDDLNREQGLLLGNSQWIEVICMKHKITLDTFRDMVADFILDCRCNAQNRHQDEQDLRSHFNNWLRIKLQSNGNNRPNINAGYRKPSPEDNIRTVEQWALEQTRKCLSGEADRERERLSEGLPF